MESIPFLLVIRFPVWNSPRISLLETLEVLAPPFKIDLEPVHPTAPKWAPFAFAALSKTSKFRRDGAPGSLAPFAS
jgi:hypothetical protein